MKNFLKKLFSDSNEISSKRLVMIVTLLLIVIGFSCNLFGIIIATHIWNGIIILCGSAAGITALEKLLKK